MERNKRMVVFMLGVAMFGCGVVVGLDRGRDVEERRFQKFHEGMDQAAGKVGEAVSFVRRILGVTEYYEQKC